MDGIQLLAVPSINLKPGSRRFSQNQGTSGSETRKPASAKTFAIQRTASLFSLGTNKRTIAPTSGVNRMIERMRDCIEQFSVARRRLPVHITHQSRSRCEGIADSPQIYVTKRRRRYRAKK